MVDTLVLGTKNRGSTPLMSNRFSLSLNIKMLYKNSYFLPLVFESSSQKKVLLVKTRLIGVNKKKLKNLCLSLGLKNDSLLTKIPKYKQMFFQKYFLTFFLQDRFFYSLIFKKIVTQSAVQVFKSYKQENNLPVRGQRTKTNKKTAKKCKVLQKSLHFRQHNIELF